MKPEYKQVAKAKYIQLTAELADGLWRECYARRYNSKQLTALLNELQSPERIEADIDDDANYFIILLAGKPIGYFAWKMEAAAMNLMHLYLKPANRGKGLGRDIIASCERLARADGKGRVHCLVHTKDLSAMGFFKACGYHALRPGTRCPGGVAMDETEMEHTLGC